MKSLFSTTLSALFALCLGGGCSTASSGEAEFDSGPANVDIDSDTPNLIDSGPILEGNSLRATIQTVGENVDPWYVLWVDGETKAVSTNGAVTFEDLVVGDRMVELTGVAGNCTVAGENPRTIGITAEAGTLTTFEVACTTEVSKIAFGSTRTGSREIFVMNADGTGTMALTNNPGFNNWRPDVSPAGAAKIAFLSNRSGDSSNVFVMNADGTEQVNLTNDPSDNYSPTWSPDGTRIAFQTSRDGGSEIYVANLDGTGLVNLTNDPGEDVEPEWSADGTKIAFTSERDGNLEIYTMNPDGTGVVNVSSNVAIDRAPSWSPDGSQISYTTNRGGSFEIHRMNADGSGSVKLADASEASWTSWSTDGMTIVYSTELEGNWEVYRMNSDGTASVNLTNNSALDGWASWWR